MPKSFSIRLVNNNPPQKRFSDGVQQALFNGDESANTNYELFNPSFLNGVERYTAYHELLVNKPGRANGQPFSCYYEPHYFPFYHDKNRSLLYINTKKVVVNSFLEHLGLNKSWPKVPIDYEAMAPILPTITGAWFCELNLKYVNSAGYFGQHVNRSDEFKKAAECGNISVLYINTPWPPPGGREYRVGITSDGAVVLSKNMSLEEHEVELVSYVYDTFIAPTQAV